MKPVFVNSLYFRASLDNVYTVVVSSLIYSLDAELKLNVYGFIARRSQCDCLPAIFVKEYLDEKNKIK